MESFESLVCEVNGGFSPDAKRAGLLKAASAGDERAAEALLLLDSAWRVDWWNEGISSERLAADVSMVRRRYATPSVNLRAALAVAEVRSAPEMEAKDRRAVLAARNVLFDPGATLPTSGLALSQLFEIAETCDSGDDLRQQFGDRVLAIARQNKDAEAYNVAAHLFLNTPKLADVDKEGWDATGDARFAASYLSGIAAAAKLTLNHPLLVRARQQYPEQTDIAGLCVALSAEQGKVSEQLLVQAIKAEYTKFSSRRPGVDLPRASAWILSSYFHMLNEQYAHSPIKL